MGNTPEDIIGFWLVQVIMLAGLFGLMVPIIPGLVIMWVGALLFGLFGHWSTLGIVLFVIISLLMIAGSLVDNVLMGAGAHKGGASWVTVAVAMLAGVVGTLAFPPIGGFIAAPLAILVLEYLRQKEWRLAWQSLKGMVAGWGLSFVVRFIIGLMMMGLWWLWAWRG